MSTLNTDVILYLLNLTPTSIVSLLGPSVCPDKYCLVMSAVYLFLYDSCVYCNCWTGLYYLHNTILAWFHPAFITLYKESCWIRSALFPVCNCPSCFLTIDTVLNFPILFFLFLPIPSFLLTFSFGIIVESSPPCHPLIVRSFLRVLVLDSFISFLPFCSLCFILSLPWNISWIIFDFLTLISASLPGPAHPRQKHSVSRHDKWQGRKWTRAGSHDLD